MKFFSFASGVDLFGLGMRQAGHEQVGHAEVDKWSNLLNEEFNNSKGGNYGDIRKIAENPSILPDFDIACAGLPCPAFSIAGKRPENPFDQAECGGDLFIHFLKIIQFKKPRILFLNKSKEFYRLVNGKEKSLVPCSTGFQNWGTMQSGKLLTARISEFHKTENECSLSDILEENPDPKYFLSWEKLTRTLASRSQQKPQLLEQ